MKKLTALLLLLVMCVAMFAGCGGEKTPAPVDPVDPTPVDPTPVDPTPVDPTPVDPTPVDPTPVDPAPAADDINDIYIEPVSYDDIYFSIGYETPKTITVNVDGYKKTNLAKEAAAAMKEDAGDAGLKTIGGYGAITTVTYNYDTQRLVIDVSNIYVGCAFRGAELATGPVITVEYRDANWTKYESVPNPDKIADGTIVNYTMDKGVVTILGAAAYKTGKVTKINKGADGKIQSVYLEIPAPYTGSGEYFVNSTATGFGKTFEEEVVVGKTYNVWFDTEGNIGYAKDPAAS